MTCRILLVDDHSLFREGLRGLAEKQPEMVVVAEAADGREGARLAKELAPDVVILDVSLPEMSGMAAASEMRRECPKAKIIALSMHSERRFVLGMLEAGAVGYVVKSGAFDELKHAIEAVCSGGTYLSPTVAGLVVDGLLGQAAATRPSRLTRRERDVLQLVAEGETTKEIAARLHVSIKTVEGYRAHIMTKLNLRSVADLTKYAVREGLTSLDS